MTSSGNRIGLHAFLALLLVAVLVVIARPGWRECAGERDLVEGPDGGSSRHEADAGGNGPGDAGPMSAGFHLRPYLQNPSSRAMTVSWLSRDAEPGELHYREVGPFVRSAGAAGAPGSSDPPDAGPPRSAENGLSGVLRSVPVLASELARDGDGAMGEPPGDAGAPGGSSEPGPYFHRVRTTGLKPSTVYHYEVVQGPERYHATFHTAPAPGAQAPVRFIALADCEATPASFGDRASWDDPTGEQAARRYLVDQARGLVDNLSQIGARHPDFVTISGDLVEASGDLPDWEELWRNLIDCRGACVFAPRLPIIAVPGNHEYWAGPNGGRFTQPASERAIRRFLRYFEAPPNHASRAEHEGRYFRLDYGPVTVIGLDVCNDTPHESPRDTNFHLLGERDPGGGHAPGFLPGSEQYRWLERQLEDSQETSPFTVVLLHHVPYSVGPHGWPPGHREGQKAWQARQDSQSGTPVRGLTELLLRRGVDVVLAGHDEMYERSELVGTEELSGGATRSHTLQVYDIGICGDGLRSPQPGLENPHQKFIAHQDAPEQWRDGRLISGGKHYGHLEVDIVPRGRTDDGRPAWRATLAPVYILPRVDPDGSYHGYERQVYDDVVTLDVVGGPGGRSGASE